ncbi:uncharacterized protein LOC133732792 [Rosa rugosa]|uniref:uncharacterized protein LOC133732792 n=1 Tax=Rosa rugosa TaxID=74645 RepID=UPI002B411497|nr:uncharacterized protein LOC133732792 [Rosa rugosa]
MSNLNKLSFAPLETTGAGYHKWVRNVRQHLKADGILSRIQVPSQDVLTPQQAAAFEENRATREANEAKAIILMTRHMNDALSSEYLNEEDPRKLWVELEQRFGNVRDSLLPDLEVRWHSLCFCDFKSVLDYNLEALRIKSLMEFCGQKITDTMLIEKTLSTFPVSALMVAKNYQIDVNAGRITRFHELIGAMNVVEKHDNILVKNYNSRPVGAKSIPKSNYSRASKGGRKERNPKERDNSGRSGPYSHPKEEGNRQDRRARNCGGKHVKRERGQASGYGGVATKERNHPQSAPKASRSREPDHKDACLRCGLPRNWARACKASQNVTNTYKMYREAREEHYMEQEDQDGDLDLRVEEFKGQDSETGDFD